MVSNIQDLKNGWRLALKYAHKQEGSILFSPAAASFNMFINEFDRAKKFDELINGTKQKKK
jgi:UDP-N-acetylmuramoylalanine-D-glutamate ligase